MTGIDSDSLRFFPTDQRFSRQELQTLSGVGDDVLGFWIKQGILRAEPAPARTHLRFGFEQIHIAVVMDAMRSLSASIGMLRAFAEVIQDGVVLAKRSKLDYAELRIAVRLAKAVHRFRRGDVFEIVGSEFFLRERVGSREDSEAYDKARRHPRDEADLIDSLKASDLLEGDVEAAATAGLSWSEQDVMAVDWWMDLVIPDILSGSDDFNWVWLAWLDEAGQPCLFAGEDAAPTLSEKMPKAAFYISVSRLIRPLWPENAKLAKKQKDEDALAYRMRRLEQLDVVDPSEAMRLRRIWGIAA